MPPLPFYNLQIYVYQNLINTVRTKQNIVENSLIEQEHLWIKPHIRLIENKSHFSGTDFDDKFPTFGVASSIMVHAPIFRMAWVCEMPCWN